MAVYVRKQPSKKKPGIYHTSTECPMVDFRTYEAKPKPPEGYVLCRRSGACSKLN